MTDSTEAPLHGVRVLDLTRLLPGPAATMHLADFGADVVKVEDTGEGDYLRNFPPQVRDARGDTVNPIFAAVNRGKRSIRIDLKSKSGREVLLRLTEGADALVEGFRPGVMDRLGLGWQALHARNRRLVLCSLTGYGQDGPLAQSAGHDINYLAMTGVLDQIRADGNIAIPNLQVGDLLGGTLTALSALLIALLAAQRTGLGRHVDCAMTDGLLAHQFFAHASLDGGEAPVAGRTLLSGGAACYRTYRCRDGGDIALGALELKFWRNFCDGVGLAPLRDRHWSLGEAPGSDAAAQTAAEVAARLAERTRDDWASLLAFSDACVTPVLTSQEALAQPQYAARALVHGRGDVTLVAPLAHVGEHRPALPDAPRAGEHAAQILAEAGYSADQIQALIAAQVVCGA